MINNILVTNKVFLIAIRILNDIHVVHFMVYEREKESGVGKESRQEHVP